MLANEAHMIEPLPYPYRYCIILEVGCIHLSNAWKVTHPKTIFNLWYLSSLTFVWLVFEQGVSDLSYKETLHELAEIHIDHNHLQWDDYHS
jgi:hypothetical protein